MENSLFLGVPILKHIRVKLIGYLLVQADKLTLPAGNCGFLVFFFFYNFMSHILNDIKSN